MRRQWVRGLAVAIVAVVAIGAGCWRLFDSERGLSILHERIGTIPVTFFESIGAGASPTVVIAHGFAGSQQLMQPFAVTLARNGYRAVTFDFPGHGRNTTPLTGGLTDHDGRGRTLVEALGAVVEATRNRPGADGRLALIGHSMASDIVVGYARDRPEIEATIAVSVFARDVTPSQPRNLLVVDGALEPSALIEAGLAIVATAAAGPAQAGVTYGDFSAGTARRLVLADGVEHIGVLYSAVSLREALDWVNTAFTRKSGGFIDRRGLSLALLFGGLIALGWTLARLLPQVAPAPLGAHLPWRRFAVVALGPALLTPLLLWKAPGGFLPLLLGDYLALHFGLYGLLTGAGLWLVRRPGAPGPFGCSLTSFGVAALCAAAFCTVALAWPTDRFVTSFVPTPGRLPLMLAMLCGVLPFFLADEWLTRRPGAPKGAYLITKICFLVSLVAAVLLNLPKLFFLVVIVPAILLLFVIYGLFSRWAYRRTRHPWVAGLANAVAFAWAMAVTFPVVG